MREKKIAPAKKLGRLSRFITPWPCVIGFTRRPALFFSEKIKHDLFCILQIENEGGIYNFLFYL